jgi:putative endonuclease
MHSDILVFVEVKTRRSQRYGKPEAAVNPGKLQHMIDSAQAYLQAHPQYTQDWRIDVVSVMVQHGKPPKYSHFENVTF